MKCDVYFIYKLGTCIHRCRKIWQDETKISKWLLAVDCFVLLAIFRCHQQHMAGQERWYYILTHFCDIGNTNRILKIFISC